MDATTTDTQAAPAPVAPTPAPPAPPAPLQGATSPAKPAAAPAAKPRPAVPVPAQAPPVPSIGRIVLYRQAVSEDGLRGTNGTREHPAMITRVWSPDCVNLHVLLDGHPSAVRVSVPQAVADPDAEDAGYTWRWPPRV